jgi:NADPH:quinone reductase
MRAARLHAYGPPESLVIEELADPVPGPTEIVVDVRAAAVNFSDILIMANRYQVSTVPPFTPGSEFAGVVASVGAEVSDLAVGDRVFGSSMVGAFASQIVVPVGSLRRIPPHIDLHEAAGFWVAYSTAYHSLRTVAAVREGDWVVVLGATGGVGSAGIDVARLLGARVVAAASTDEKLEICAQRGAEGLINYSTEDLKTRIREITGLGADVVLDPVGGPYSEQALRSTRWGGRFVCIGFASGVIPRIPLNLVLLKGVHVMGLDVRTFREHAPHESQRDDDELFDHFLNGRVRPNVSRAFPLAEASAALRTVADRQVTGKVVIVP